MGDKVRSENYIVIQGWMINDLKLKGNELLAYAIIYGFSQTTGQVFSGSLQYLAEWTNSTRQGISKNLKALVEKGYIVKKDKIINGVKFCEYYATELNEVYNKVDDGVQQSLTPPIQQSLTNNINIDNINNNINNNIVSKNKKFVKPSLEEVKQYCLERKNNIDPENFIDYYDSNGWKVGNNTMKDWKAAVRTWERRNANNTKKPIRKEELPDWYYNEPQKGEAPTEEELREIEEMIKSIC